MKYTQQENKGLHYCLSKGGDKCMESEEKSLTCIPHGFVYGFAVNWCPFCGYSPSNNKSISMSGINAAFELTKRDNLKTKSRLILVGAGGSGKDYLKKLLHKKGYSVHVGYTSRPPRDGEKDGKDYHFVSKEKFEEMIAADCFHEHMTFRDNYYGTTKESMKSCDVFIMTPPIIDQMSDAMRKSSFVIYLYIPEQLRARRLALRGDMKEVRRRILADKDMFEAWANYDLIITDPLF